jgi:hypothetical protein
MQGLLIEMGSQYLLPWLALNHDPPNLCLLNETVAGVTGMSHYAWPFLKTGSHYLAKAGPAVSGIIASYYHAWPIILFSAQISHLWPLGSLYVETTQLCPWSTASGITSTSCVFLGQPWHRPFAWGHWLPLLGSGIWRLEAGHSKCV